MLDTRKNTIDRNVSTYFLVRKGLSIDDVGVSRDTVLREIRPGAGFETGDFIKEKLGGLYRRTTPGQEAFKSHRSDRVILTRPDPSEVSRLLNILGNFFPLESLKG